MAINWISTGVTKPETEDDYALDIVVCEGGDTAYVLLGGKQSHHSGCGSALRPIFDLTGEEVDIIDAAITAKRKKSVRAKRRSNGLYSDPESQGQY